MRVVVVGGMSFIGRHLIARLADDSFEIAATHRGPQPPQAEGLRWIETDLAGTAPTAAWPERCDAVIYLAQSRRWRRVPDGAADVFAVNVRAVFEAAEYARRAGAARFIFASSGSVYGTAADTSERHPLDISEPRQLYVASKIAAETLLSAYTPAMHVIVLRLFVPYGEHQGADMLLPQIAERVRAAGAVTLDGEAGLEINPVAAPDVAEAIARCLRLDRSATLNVAGPQAIRLRNIAELIGGLVGREPLFEHRDKSPMRLIGDTSLLAATLGWSPAITPEAGLAGWLRRDPT